MKTIKHQADFCAIGGGVLAGMCAAIQAGAVLHGIKTILMHERLLGWQ